MERGAKAGRFKRAFALGANLDEGLIVGKSRSEASSDAKRGMRIDPGPHPRVISPHTGNKSTVS
jgi:hypothetical protein